MADAGCYQEAASGRAASLCWGLMRGSVTALRGNHAACSTIFLPLMDHSLGFPLPSGCRCHRSALWELKSSSTRHAEPKRFVTADGWTTSPMMPLALAAICWET